MSVNLSGFISDFFSLHGGIVSPSAGGEMEYIAPAELAGALGIGEFGRFVFNRDVPALPVMSGSVDPAGAGAVFVSYDSELTRAMRALLARSGALCAAAFPAAPVNPEKFAGPLLSGVGFSNAAFRMTSRVGCDVTFDLVVLKYTAVSDDRQEGLTAILVNPLNGRTAKVSRNDLASLLETLQPPRGQKVAFGEEIKRSLEAARPAALKIFKAEARDFFHNLEKRLNRDIQRIGAYYSQLSDETNQALLRATAQGEMKKDKAERLRAKNGAIAAEKAWKIKDALSKYSVTVSVDPILLVRITSPGAVFRLEIQRKAEVRPLVLMFNPILKKLETVSCESCEEPRGMLSVCDGRMHIVCETCLSTCPACGKKVCRSCSPGPCPRCGQV